jgi:DNA helicase IV
VGGVLGDTEELALEQAHLDQTWAAYERLLAALAGRRFGADEFTEEVLEKMRRERLRRYTASSGPLYFGRIDERDGRTLYVGRHAIANEHDDLLAINWRAPAAQPFYSATPQRPRGVLRRRRLDVDERRVGGFVDELLAAGEGMDGLEHAIVEDITRRRVGEMRQIIATITPEQYELIATDVEGALVIQGGPGTGKTAVGLHRAAYLLYSDPQLAREGVLVVGPNDVFVAYIDQVLPSLGETEVEQRSADALVPARGERVPESPDVAALKGSGAMAEVLERLLWGRVSVTEEAVEVEVTPRVAVPVTPGDLRDAIAAARERSRAYQPARERFRERLAGVIAGGVSARARGTVEATEQELVGLVRKSRDYQKLADKTWPRVNAQQLFGWLYDKRRLAATGLLAPEQIALLAANSPKKQGLRAADVPLLDEGRWLVEPDLKTYGHIVLDEAQNLTPMELRVVTRRARRRSLTILGDIAQRTGDARLGGWEEILSTAGVPDFTVHELLISYRVPDDFLRLAASVRPAGADAVPRGVRDAPWPAVAVRCSSAGVVDTVAELAARMAADVGSVAVIAPDEWHDALGGADADAAGRLSGGVDLVSLRTVKGLEFDAAIVVEPAAILRQPLDGGAGGLYTALTRSTRALVVVHFEPLPEGLELPSAELGSVTFQGGH